MCYYCVKQYEVLKQCVTIVLNNMLPMCSTIWGVEHCVTIALNNMLPMCSTIWGVEQCVAIALNIMLPMCLTIWGVQQCVTIALNIMLPMCSTIWGVEQCVTNALNSVCNVSIHPINLTFLAAIAKTNLNKSQECSTTSLGFIVWTLRTRQIRSKAVCL
jgi:hypothetical protein